MKRILGFGALALAGIVIAVAMTTLIVNGDEPYQTQTLYAGKTMDAGDVNIWNDDDYLYVQFITADDWEIAETHVHVSSSLSGLPASGSVKNLVPGQFDYSQSFDPWVSTHTEEIPADSFTGTVYIAAHAALKHFVGDQLIGYELVGYQIVGYESDLEDLVSSLPGSWVNIKAWNPDNSASPPPAYWKVQVYQNTGIDGYYQGWCVDVGRGMDLNTEYKALVISSTETIPTGAIDHPDELDKANWVINQDFVGRTSPGGYGTYTYGDVQMAIWMLIDDSWSSGGLGPSDSHRWGEIVSAADSNGEGFVPGYDDEVLIIVVPITTDSNGNIVLNSDGTLKILNQVLAIEMEVPGHPVYEPIYQPIYEPKYSDETGWGSGTRFNKKGNWATYFTYTMDSHDGTE